MLGSLAISFAPAAANPFAGVRVPGGRSCFSGSPRAVALASPVVSPATNLYDVLGVGIGATDAEIKAAYRRLARECHPDVVEEDRRGESTGAFIRVRGAYATLSDPMLRAQYDREIMAAAVAPRRSSGLSPYGGSPRRNRTWETDQCW